MKLVSKDYDKINSEVVSSREQLKTVLHDYEQTRNEVEDLNKAKTRIYTEFVTILGVFTTIIFATFGGLSILKNVLGNIEEVPTEKLMVFSSLTVSTIILLLFILLSGIARLTGLNIRSCGCDSKDKNCPHNVFQKHPTIIISNLILFYVFLMGLTGFIIPYNELFNLFTYNISTLKELIISVSALLLILIFFCGMFFIRYTKKYNQN